MVLCVYNYTHTHLKPLPPTPNSHPPKKTKHQAVYTVEHTHTHTHTQPQTALHSAHAAAATHAAQARKRLLHEGEKLAAARRLLARVEGEAEARAKKGRETLRRVGVVEGEVRAWVGGWVRVCVRVGGVDTTLVPFFSSLSSISPFSSPPSFP